MKRKATAVWNGPGKGGTGRLTTGSGAMDGTPYSAAMRFESEDGKAGTNPEELIAAAHAGCFAMALSFQLSGAGSTPDELAVECVVTIEKEGEGWTIRSSELTLRGTVPGIDADEFKRLADAAKAGCPVSRALAVNISLDATLT
jgi:lipoyl-dependent peroxiredoxin